MKCMKCGADNPDTANFCRKCGTKIERPEKKENFSKEPDSRQTGKLDKKTKIIMGIGAAVVLLLLIGFIKPDSMVIDLEDYVSIEYSGYDSHGVVNVLFNEEEFRTKYLKENKEDGESILDTYMGNYAMDSLSENVYIDPMPPYVRVLVTAEEKLSNGDRVKIRFDYDNEKASELGLKYKGEKIEKKVKGLEDMPVIDPFEELELNYEGVAPFGELAGLNNRNGMDFVVENAHNLENGDQVKLTVRDETLERLYEEGYEVERTEKVYTVEGVAEYILEPEKLSEEGLDIIINFAEERLDYDYDSYDYESVKYELCGTSVIYPKSQETSEANDYWYSKFVLLYKVEGYDKEKEEDFIQYVPYVCADVAQKPDGGLYHLNPPHQDGIYTTIEEFKVNYLTTYSSEYEIALSKDLKKLMK